MTFQLALSTLDALKLIEFKRLETSSEQQNIEAWQALEHASVHLLDELDRTYAIAFLRLLLLDLASIQITICR